MLSKVDIPYDDKFCLHEFIVLVKLSILLKSLFYFQMSDIVTEQWMQIQRLEQALHITHVYLSECDFTVLYD